jgi:hypothetical protein
LAEEENVLAGEDGGERAVDNVLALGVDTRSGGCARKPSTSALSAASSSSMASLAASPSVRLASSVAWTGSKYTRDDPILSMPLWRRRTVSA